MLRTLILQPIVLAVLVCGLAPRAEAMIRHVFIFEPPVSLDEFDIWYFRHHSQDCMKFFGPWLRRYETYRVVPMPEADVEKLGVYRGRYTELWYDSVDTWREASPYGRPYTPAPWGGGGLGSREKPAASIIIPAMPTEDFLRKEPNPSQRPILRWIFVMRYPQGVSVEDGEKWYLEKHTQEAKTMPGLLRYVSYKSVKDSPARSPWVRMTELWFKDADAFHTARASIQFTPPPWAQGEQKWLELVSAFVGYEPDRDFLLERTTRLP